MIDRPDAARLLQAMAETLEQQVLPTTRGGAQHAVRVVANLCQILERELQDAGQSTKQSRQALAELLGRDGTLDELAAALDERLRAHEIDPSFAERVRDVLEANARRRLAIDKPGYVE